MDAQQRLQRDTALAEEVNQLAETHQRIRRQNHIAADIDRAMRLGVMP